MELTQGPPTWCPVPLALSRPVAMAFAPAIAAGVTKPPKRPLTMDAAMLADVDPVATFLPIAGPSKEALIPLFKLMPLSYRPVTLEPPTLILGVCVAAFTALIPIEDNWEELTRAHLKTEHVFPNCSQEVLLHYFRSFFCKCLLILKLSAFLGQVPPH